MICDERIKAYIFCARFPKAVVCGRRVGAKIIIIETIFDDKNVKMEWIIEMKLVIYRDKKSKKITNFHELRPNITQEQIDSFNANEHMTTFVEIVDLEEDSVAYYFYSLKTSQIEEYAEDLRDLESRISDIARDIDDRLYEFDRMMREQKEGD